MSQLHIAHKNDQPSGDEIRLWLVSDEEAILIDGFDDTAVHVFVSVDMVQVRDVLVVDVNVVFAEVRHFEGWFG
jgi:hypothetical protein